MTVEDSSNPELAVQEIKSSSKDLKLKVSPEKMLAEESAGAQEENEIEENEENEKISLELASEYIASGTQALALGNYEEAAENLAVAVEAQVNHLGPLALEIASTYHLYGRALFHAGVQKSSVLGERADQVKSENPSQNASSSADNFVFEGDEDIEAEEETQTLQDIEIPLGDDLELAWENLDCARVILAKETASEYVKQLADVHLSLGDVSLESENFDEAIIDYKKALELKMENTPDHFRELAEVHFKLALAYEYSEQNELAVDEVTNAMNMIKKQMETVKSLMGSGKEPKSSSNDAASVEIDELEGFLTELGAKINDINALLEKETSGEAISAPEVAVNEMLTKVQDISSLVKKRKLAEASSSEEKKAKQ